MSVTAPAVAAYNVAAEAHRLAAHGLARAIADACTYRHPGAAYLYIHHHYSYKPSYIADADGRVLHDYGTAEPCSCTGRPGDVPIDGDSLADMLQALFDAGSHFDEHDCATGEHCLYLSPDAGPGSTEERELHPWLLRPYGG